MHELMLIVYQSFLLCEIFAKIWKHILLGPCLLQKNFKRNILLKIFSFFWKKKLANSQKEQKFENFSSHLDSVGT